MHHALDSAYAACPTCGHAPLPEEQSFPAACPACGVVLAKVRARAARKDFDTGLLRHARGIGIAAAWAGKAMMLASLAWAAWMVWLQRARLSDAVFAGTGHE